MRRHFGRFRELRARRRAWPHPHAVRLHHRLFFWFGISILATIICAALVMRFVFDPGRGPWQSASSRLRTFTAHQFAAVWRDEAARSRLVHDAASDLGLGVTVLDAAGRELQHGGQRCDRPDAVVAVHDAGLHLGEVRVCGVWAATPGPGWRPFTLIGVLGVMLWVASGAISRRLTRPLSQLTRVTEDIGSGKLQSRVRLNPHWPGELGALATSINQMGSRIEEQMNEQRELLATVSHEIRSPLARVVVLLELAREQQFAPAIIDEIEHELGDVDMLVGELLAKSRLDFKTLDYKELDAAELAIRAMERALANPELLSVEADDRKLEGDPTLLVRALINLLDNAAKHAGGVERLCVTADAEYVNFVVEDVGPGFEADELPRVFDSFVRGQSSAGSSLGLGLALVRRIAVAHGGRAWAENRPERGARVGFSCARRPLRRVRDLA